MEPVLFALPLAAVAGVVAVLLRRRRPVPLDVREQWSVPTVVDRTDFERPEAPWLVVAFTSATCHSCAEVWSRTGLLASEEVAVQEVEAKADEALHVRYRIDAVPLVIVADAQGSVRTHFLGPFPAAELWGALAELRQPGSVPEGCRAHLPAPDAQV
jgi:hypothetical protein